MIGPMLLGKQDTPTARPGDVCQPKIDGWRLIAIKQRNASALVTRRGTQLAIDPIQDALEFLPMDCVLDGELAYFDDNDISHLPDLLTHTGRLAYVVFDVLSVAGKSVCHLPLSKRRQLLELLLLDVPEPVQNIEQCDGAGAEALFSVFTNRGGEGIVLKDSTAPYHVGKRSSTWRKVKPAKEAA